MSCLWSGPVCLLCFRALNGLFMRSVLGSDLVEGKPTWDKQNPSLHLCKENTVFLQRAPDNCPSHKATERTFGCMAIKWVPVVRILRGISPSPNTSTGPTLSLMKGRADIFLETRFLARVKEKEHVFPFLLCAGICPDSSQWKLKVMMQFWGTEILPTREVERGFSVLTQPLRVFPSNSSLKYFSSGKYPALN